MRNQKATYAGRSCRTSQPEGPFVGPWDPDAALKDIRQNPNQAWDTPGDSCESKRQKTQKTDQKA